MACNKDENNKTSNLINNQTEEKINNNKEEPVDDDEEKNEDSIDPDVYITGEVIVKDDEIIVKGETNAPKGVTIHSSGITLTSGWQNISFIDEAVVQDDGSFQFTFPTVGLYTNVTLSLSNNAETEEVYGVDMEKVTSTQRYMRSEKNKYEVKTEFIIYPFIEKPYTIPLEIPRLDRPDDYGEPNIWMEVNYSTDHYFIIIEGKSNLVEGTFLGGNLYNSDNQLMPYSFDHTHVNPDGTFTLRVPYETLQSGLYMPIIVEPSNMTWENPLDHYGDKGEFLQGDLVKKNSETDEQYVEYIVDFTGPQINIPEDVNLTMEGEEVKLQVPNNLLFDSDQSSLRPEAGKTLDQVLTELKNLPDQTEIYLNGHTDHEGDPQYNVALSEERVQAVFDYFQENGELDHLLIALHGYGGERPIESNDEEEGRAKNRRIEIVINPVK